MIGHEKKNVGEPNESFMAEFDSVEHGGGEFGIGQLRRAPVLAGYCNKIDFLLWVNPQRHIVRQRMTAGKCQLDKDGPAAVSVKSIPRQPIPRQPGAALDASARRPYLEYLPIFEACRPGALLVGVATTRRFILSVRRLMRSQALAGACLRFVQFVAEFCLAESLSLLRGKACHEK